MTAFKKNMTYDDDDDDDKENLLCKKIIKYLVVAGLPLNHIHIQPSFHDLLNTVVEEGKTVNIPHYNTLIEAFNCEYIEKREQLAKLIGKTDTICLAATYWTASWQKYVVFFCF
jgi:hypothetical protein